MFGLIKNVVNTAVNVATAPIDLAEDLVNGEIAPRTEKKVKKVTENISDIFDPTTWW